MNAEFPPFENGGIQKHSERAPTLDRDITPVITVMHRVMLPLCCYDGTLLGIGALARNKTDYQPSDRKDVTDQPPTHYSLSEILYAHYARVF